MLCRSSNGRSLVLALLVGLTVSAVPVPGAQAARSSSDLVLVREGDVVREDYYTAGNRVVIRGLVEGDLLAVAFEEVVVEGEVTGSVTALASRVVVTGTVGGSVRAAADLVRVEGEVGGDVVAVSRLARIAPEAQVGRDVLVLAVDADLQGSVGRDVAGNQRALVLGGTVDGGVNVTVGRLEVAEGASVVGDLAYRSEQEATVAPGVEIGGTLLHRRPLDTNVRVQAIQLLTAVITALVILIVGLALLWGAPTVTGRAVEEVRRRTGTALVAGLAALMAPAVLVGLVGLALRSASPAVSAPLLVVFG
ncbi:MAG: hypothetical protein ACRDVM_07870, partial [Acidimicrobiia bacterium]